MQDLQNKEWILDISLLNTLLADKYCVYQMVDEGKYLNTFLAMNVKDKNDYIVEYHKIWEVQNHQERREFRYRILKKAEIFSRVRSPYVKRCYDVYDNQSSIVVVYEFFPGYSLAQELNLGKIATDNFPTIRQHMYKALQAIHQIGYIVKKIQLDKVYYKNGCYKIKDFGIFINQLNLQQDPDLPPELIVTNNQTEHDILKCDVWALGLLYLKIIFNMPANTNNQYVHSQCLFTWNMELQLNNDHNFGINEIKFLKKSLMIDPRSRLTWNELNSYFFKSESDNYWKNYQTLITLPHENLKIQKVFQETPGQDKVKPALFAKVQLEKIINDQYDDEISMKMRIQKFRFKGLDRDDVEIYLQSRKMSPQKQFQLYEKQLFEIKKCQYIHTSILETIQKHSLLNLSTRKYIEFMYLISSRCFTDFSIANQKIKQLISSENPTNYDILKSIEKNVLPFEKKKNQLFQKYSQGLTSSESQIFSMVLDRWRLFTEKQEKQKSDRFLAGVEKIDYTRQQQINFTCQFYLPSVIQKLKSRQKNSAAKKVERICKIYRSILNLKKQDHKRGKQITGYVETLLREKTKSFKY